MEKIVATEECSDDHEEFSNEQKEVEVEKVNGKAKKGYKDKENEKEGGKENGKEKSPSPTKSNTPSSIEKKESPFDKISHKINQEIQDTKIVRKEDMDNDGVKGKENGKGKDKEEEDEDGDGDEEEKEVEVSLKLNRSLAWYQASLPPEKNSYTPVHILSRTISAATASATTSSSTSTEKPLPVVKDVLDHSIDCVRNEVLEVLTKTIYSVARSLRSDPVREIRLDCMV